MSWQRLRKRNKNKTVKGDVSRRPLFDYLRNDAVAGDIRKGQL